MGRRHAAPAGQPYTDSGDRDRQQAEQREGAEPTGLHWRIAEHRCRMFQRNKPVVELDVVTTGSPQTHDIPGVVDPELINRRQHQPHVGNPVGQVAALSLLVDNAAAH